MMQEPKFSWVFALQDELRKMAQIVVPTMTHVSQVCSW
jgi:hypothetical protein